MARMRGAGLIEAFNPSPCPSPSGRGNDVAAVRLRKLCTERATASPLPEGEGQGEGRFAQFVTLAGVKFTPKRLRGNNAAVNLAPVIDTSGFAGVIK